MTDLGYDAIIDLGYNGRWLQRADTIKNLCAGEEVTVTIGLPVGH